MHIDWHALGSVFATALIATVGLVGVFTVGIVGLSRHNPGVRAAGEDPAGAATPPRDAAAVLRTGGAYACFALCAAAVAYGIHLIVAK